MKQKPLKTIRRLILFFGISLFLSGLTAMPLITELTWILEVLPDGNALYRWIEKVLTALQRLDREAPFLFYGYDWLAFAHFVLALLFVGPYRDPVRNIWVIEFGMLASVLIFPFAFIAGPLRGIPMGWILIDCSFGVGGFALLWLTYHRIKAYERSLLMKEKAVPATRCMYAKTSMS